MGGNEKPLLSSADGMERRLHIAEFPHSIPLNEQIPKIEEKLKDEWPAILAWAIEGCLLWQEKGMIKPNEEKNTVREYKDMQNNNHNWQSEKTEKCDSKVKQTDLYASYSAYIKSAGMGALGSTRLGPELKKRGYVQQKSNGVRYWFGLQLLDNIQIPSWAETDADKFWKINMETYWQNNHAGRAVSDNAPANALFGHVRAKNWAHYHREIPGCGNR